MKQHIIERVNAILKDQLYLSEPIKPTDTLADDLGADSLDIVEIVMALEEEFDIEIPDLDCNEATASVGKIYEFVESRVSR